MIRKLRRTEMKIQIQSRYICARTQKTIRMIFSFNDCKFNYKILKKKKLELLF